MISFIFLHFDNDEFARRERSFAIWNQIPNSGDDDTEDACGMNTIDGRTKENRLKRESYKLLCCQVLEQWRTAGGGKEEETVFFSSHDALKCGRTSIQKLYGTI